MPMASKRPSEVVGPRVSRVFGEPRRRLRGRAHAPRATTIVLPLALFAQGDLYIGAVLVPRYWFIFIFYICGPAVDHDRVL